MYSHSDVLKLIRAQVRECGSQKHFAALCGISQPYLSDILKRRRGQGGVPIGVLVKLGLTVSGDGYTEAK